MNNPQIIYYDNVQKNFEIYRNDNGEYHREYAPAIIKYYKTGQKRFESYFINDKLHREDGPAFIKWNENEQIVYEEYWINNKKLDIFEIRKLKLEKFKYIIINKEKI